MMTGRLRLFFLAIFCCLICLSVAPPPEGKGGGKGDKGNNGRGNGNGNGNGRKINDYKGNQKRLNDDELKTLQGNCQKRNGCKGQSERAKQRRNSVKESMKRDRRGGEIKGWSDDKIEKRFKKIQDAKQALFDVNGLTGYEPHDDGLFAGDMQLNEQQAERIINRTKGIVDPTETGDVPLLDIQSLLMEDSSTRKKRADTLALDYYTGNRWPSTSINFYIDPNDFTTTQANVIRAALKSISTASCLKFVEQWKYPVLEYVKTPSGTDAGTCGWSEVGYQGNYNAVNINFASSVCRSTLQGVVVHETLHAVGFVHEHSRYDRDRYLSIDWNNVDPQSYDVYDKDDPHDHNPYCVTFDPLSIMHYDPYVGAIDGSKPVMKPYSSPDYYLPRMGQGMAMAASDAKLLNRLYCQSSTCKDKSTNCGWTACGDCNKFGSVCPRSCGKCT